MVSFLTDKKKKEKMIQLTDKQIQEALDDAYKKAGQHAYFGNGFRAGVEFAIEQVKKN